MKNFSLLLFAAALSLTGCISVDNSGGGREPIVASSTVPLVSEHYERVIRVIDGDTFIIAANWSPWSNLVWKVRVIGIDTPEHGRLAKCAAENAKSNEAARIATQLLASSGNRIRMRHVRHDNYGGRLDAQVILTGGRDMAAEMLKAGVAKSYNGQGSKPNWCA